MHTLSEMEHKLLGEAKRQRQAIEASDLVAPAAQDDTYGFQDATNGSIKCINTKSSPNTTAAQITDDLDEDISPETEVGERGAKRPPAVNSDRMPLPWTGRLGYVSIATSTPK